MCSIHTCGDADCSSRACRLGRGNQRLVLLLSIGLPWHLESSVANFGRLRRLHRLALHAQSRLFALTEAHKELLGWEACFISSLRLVPKMQAAALMS